MICLWISKYRAYFCTFYVLNMVLTKYWNSICFNWTLGGGGSVDEYKPGPLAEYEHRIATGGLKPGDKFQVFLESFYSSSCLANEARALTDFGCWLTLQHRWKFQRWRAVFKWSMLFIRLVKGCIASHGVIANKSTNWDERFVSWEQERALMELQELYENLMRDAPDIGLEKNTPRSSQRNRLTFTFKDFLMVELNWKER